MKQSDLYFYLAGIGCLMLMIALPLAAWKEWNDTNLLIAIKSQDNTAVQAALDAGANPNTDERHLLLFFRQSRGGYSFMSQPHEMPAIITAVQSGKVEIVETLLKRGANVNSVNKDGETAIEHISDCQNDEDASAVAKLLLRWGAKVNLNDGKALSAAVHTRQPDVAKIILDLSKSSSKVRRI